MSEFGYGSEKYEWDESEEHQMLAVHALELIQDVLMDENPDIDRPDIWYVTWAELQLLDDDLDDDLRFNRRAASNEIQDLYKRALDHLYPQLRTASSAEDRMIQMALIPNLPVCEGTYSASAYLSVDDSYRQMTCATMFLDNGALAVAATISDQTNDTAYKLVMDINGGVEVSYGVTRGDADEAEMLAKVPPMQVDNLARILSGLVHPIDLEMKLLELRVESEREMNAQEADELIREVEKRYYNAVAGMMFGGGEDDDMPSITDCLRQMLDIVNERRWQLDSGL